MRMPVSSRHKMASTSPAVGVEAMSPQRMAFALSCRFEQSMPDPTRNILDRSAASPITIWSPTSLPASTPSPCAYGGGAAPVARATTASATLRDSTSPVNVGLTEPTFTNRDWSAQ